jgi:hypothetical protein
MAFCVHCGAEQEQGKFCQECGKPKETAARQTAVAVAPNDTVVLAPAKVSASPQRDVVFYDQCGMVKVTNTRFVVPGKTFAIANVTSVKFEEIPAKIGWPLSFLVIGVIMLFSDEIRGFGVLLAICGGLWLWASKAEYAVALSTSAGEVEAIKSKNRKYIGEIVDALDEAIIYRR